MCCVLPCYLDAESVYISKKTAYLYTVRNDSLSKKFNTKQIYLIEDVIKEIDTEKLNGLTDYDEQLCRYSCFMCFAILAAAAEAAAAAEITYGKERDYRKGGFSILPFAVCAALRMIPTGLISPQ